MERNNLHISRAINMMVCGLSSHIQYMDTEYTVQFVDGRFRKFQGKFCANANAKVFTYNTYPWRLADGPT